MGVDTDITPIQSFEITPETLEFTVGNDTKNIGIKHFLCLRRTLPKTRLSQAILYENVSYGRQLGMKMESMKKDRLRNAQVLDSNMRAFKQTQERKKQKWKRVDEVRLSNMNFPCRYLNSESERPKSGQVMYRMNEFKPEGDKPEVQTPILPKMNLTIRREMTEIVTHREETFMTKFPEIIEYDPKLIDKYNKYCGKHLLEEGGSGRDDRFHRFVKSLSPAKVDQEDYPIENLKSMSRLYKYSTREDKDRLTPRSARLVPKSHQQNLKMEVTKRFDAIKSRENTFYADETDSITDRLQRANALLKQTTRYQKRGEYVLETYRSDDVIYVGKNKHLNQDDIPEEFEGSVLESASVTDGKSMVTVDD